MSLTVMDGYALPNAASVARSDASSTGDEFQWASVIVVAFEPECSCAPGLRGNGAGADRDNQGESCEHESQPAAGMSRSFH